MGEGRRVDLDDPASWSGLDEHGMLAMGEDFPRQCREGLAIGEGVELSSRYTEMPANIVVCGMGGSAIGGDLFAKIFEEQLPVPVQVVRDYALPSFVDERTLVIACSYSGNTEEVLSAYREAVARGSRVLAVTSGGQLEQASLANRTPVAKVPGGRPPRASTGYMLMPLVALAPRMGLVPPVSGAVNETLRLLDQQADAFGHHTPAAGNHAKKLAQHLAGRFPLIYGTAPFMGPVAFRWRTQLNENSKVLAISAELPEMNHNEVVGWELGLGMVNRPAVVFLTIADEHPRIADRLLITQELLGEDADPQVEIALGTARLAQVMTAMYLGDMMTLYLAFLNGVDPYTITPINTLKRRLAELT